MEENLGHCYYYYYYYGELINVWMLKWNNTGHTASPRQSEETIKEKRILNSTIEDYLTYYVLYTYCIIIYITYY